MNLQTYLQFDLNLYAGVFLLVILLAMRARFDTFNFGARLFRALVVVNIAMLLLEILSWRYDGLPGARARFLNFTTNWIYIWLNPLMPCLWTAYIDYRIFGSRRRLAKRLYYAQPMIATTGLMLVQLFHPLVFSVNSANVYARQAFLWVPFGASVMMLLFALSMAFRNRDNLQFRLTAIILLFVTVPLAAAVVQLLYYGIHLIWPLMSMVLVVTYVTLENHNASVDHLTGLFNRMRVDEYVRRLVETRTRFGIVIFDLDNFKLINDQHGHQAGDTALVRFARALVEVFADQRMVARFGGDEFVVVTRNVDPDALERLNDQLAAHEIPPFSAGIAVHDPEREAGFEELFVAADNRMYEAKSRNKNMRRRAGDRPLEVQLRPQVASE